MFLGNSQNISCVNRGKGFVFSNGKCYYISSDPANVLSWFEARNDCINKNGDLATIDSKQTKQTIDAMIKGAGITTTCWLGLTRSTLSWTTGIYHTLLIYSGVYSYLLGINDICSCFQVKEKSIS